MIAAARNDRLLGNVCFPIRNRTLAEVNMNDRDGSKVAFRFDLQKSNWKTFSPVSCLPQPSFNTSASTQILNSHPTAPIHHKINPPL